MRKQCEYLYMGKYMGKYLEIYIYIKKSVAYFTKVMIVF